MTTPPLHREQLAHRLVLQVLVRPGADDLTALEYHEEVGQARREVEELLDVR